ncbi:MAG: right-handed parallel beta-helix repeat-containing protein, partial [Clostridia bacterium]|nr:right-handed parallel beta-helix repeat-containing protein [Clostridia bacterium]
MDSVNGVSVTRISFTQITVSGTPTADVTLTLPSPKEMADPQTAVCRIKDVYYATIGEAVNDVTADDTVITILRDCEFDGLTEVAGHDIILESGETDVTVTLTGAMKFGKNNQSEIFTLRGNPAADTTLTIKPKLTDGTNAFRPIAIRSGNTLTVESGAVLEGSRVMTGNGGMVNVAKGATLNLNGGTIRDCSAFRGGAVYVDGGNCTIYEGRIENCTAEQGGAVYVSYNGKCFLYEGSIENCTAKHRTIAAAANSTVNAAGGAVYAVGLLQMENSTIKNCTAEYGKGGGVYLYPEQGTFWMQDSQISGCAATENADADLYYNDGRGGAVYVGKAKNTDAPDLCVVGSRITGNTAKEGGGVYLHEDGTMAAYREAYVSENTGGNVFVSDGAAIIAVMEYSQYALTGNAVIGVTTRTEPTIGAPVRFGKTKADCKEYFISDSGNADVVYDADGKALLLQCTKKEETPAATFNATGYDTGTLDGLTAGMTYAVNGGTPVTVEGTSVTFTDIALPFVITVMQPGDGVTAYDSDPQTIELTRPDAPTLEVTPIEKVGDKGVIPTTTAHQKSTDGSVWTDCDGAWTDLDGGTYYVRTKASGTVLASGATQFFFRYDPQTDVTVTAATQKEDTVITATFAVGTTGEVEFTLTGKENQYSFTAPIEFEKAQISQKLATDDYALTVSFAGSDIFLSDTVQTSFTVACAHEWNEPTWDWTDVDNPTYTATCKLCEDGTVSDSVQSVKGGRVEATVNKDAYTPYTATVTLDGHSFTGTFNLVEKGTAFDVYKEQMRQAAEDKRLPGDSDACNRLIDDAIDAIDA